MAQKLTLEQRKEYARVFVELDSDGNGWLSREEVGIWLRNSGYNLSDQEKESVFRWMDGNSDGKITLDEFLGAMAMINKTSSSRGSAASSASSTTSSATCRSSASGSESQRSERSGESDLRGIFNSMDTDGDGQLSEDELLTGLTKAGYSVTRQQIKTLIANLDKDGDGQISYIEFIRAFKA